MECRFDAAVVHGYWPSQRGNGLYEQGVRGKLITALSAREFHNGTVAWLVTANGSPWGKDYMPVGELMRRDWIEKYSIPEDRIVIRPTALPTSDEVEAFSQLALDNNWRNILDIAFARHHWTIRVLFPKSDRYKVTYKSAEQIAKEVGSPEERRAVDQLRRSHFERNLIIYEAGQRILLSMGFKEQLRQRARSIRQQKGHSFFLQFDDYEL